MILLTGYSGFVGQHLVGNIESHKLKLLGRTVVNDVSSKNFLQAEIDSQLKCGDFLDGVEVIIHLAGRVHVMSDTERKPLEAYREVNTLGTYNLAKQAVKSGVKRFIFVSSIKSNGDFTKVNKPFRYDDLHSPTDFYGRSKQEAEQRLMQLAENTGLEVVIIRPTLIYGPGVKANFASLMNLVSKGIPLPFGCIRDNKRSLVSVDNLVDLIVRCIDHPKAANQVFLVSDDHDVSTSEMVREMAFALGKPERQLAFPVWCYSVVGKLFNKSAIVNRLTGSLQVDISHTKETLGWVPPQSLQEGFKQTAEAFLQSKKSSGKE